MNLLVIGAGAIGREVLKRLAGDDRVHVTHVLRRTERHDGLPAHPGGVAPRVISTLDALDTRPDFALECAGHEAVKAHVPALLRQGIDVALVSVGSLAEPGLAETLEAAARAGEARLTLVSGAIAGIDALASARIAGLEEVIYTGRKPPLGWLDTHAERLCDLRSLEEATVIFEGSAGEAARLYPKNANVAATVSLAGLGLDRTRARLIADPAVKRNIHQVRALGAFGELELTIGGNPLPDNPKTSALAAYSAVRAALNRVASIVI